MDSNSIVPIQKYILGFSDNVLIYLVEIFYMDFMLEEELIDLMTFCLQNPDSNEVAEKHQRITEIGHELFADGGVDALENFFFALQNRITQEIEKDPSPMRALWNGITDEWQY